MNKGPTTPGVAASTSSKLPGAGAPPRLFRVRILLRATAPISLHAHHGAAVYALLAAANAEDDGDGAAVADGLLLDAPEQGRVHLRPGELYAFGFTLLDDDGVVASRRLARWVRGLRRIGTTGKPKTWGLRGNFTVATVQDVVSTDVVSTDVVSTAVWEPGAALAPMDEMVFARETAALLGQDVLTIRFLSPLRTRHGSNELPAAERYCNETVFRPERFVRRVRRRVEELGLLGPIEPSVEDPIAELLENRLVWLDLPYGPPNRRKVMGGAVGRIRIRVADLEARRALVLGQYVRVGEGTRFGFGRYRIEELGREPFAVARATPLLALAAQDEGVDRVAQAFDLEGGRLRRAAHELAEGRWTPGTTTRVRLRVPGKRDRALSIPSHVDRALQRVVFDRLAPALDLLFETSSFAYRRGFSRATAAARIADAWDRGYRFAVRSDFRRFFDSVDHRVLRERLEAYLGDDALVRALMAWVEAAAPAPGLGLPTGSPLSPLLANVLLDAFDEEVARDGGFLVRYADDFVIFVRTRAEADRLLDEARSAADELRLVLNEDKTTVLDLAEPFDFLGFRFRRAGNWTSTPLGGVRTVDALGWEEAPAVTPASAERVVLPGETEGAAPVPRATGIIGPGVRSLTVTEGRLVCRYGADLPDMSVSLDRLGGVVVLGGTAIDAATLRALAEHELSLVVADDTGRFAVALTPEGGLEHPDVAAAQVDASRDPVRALSIARTLVRAKIEGYASLAAASASAIDNTAAGLRELAGRAFAARDLAALRGVEGAAGALWYARLSPRLGNGLRFDRRVAPRATDPVNILLNLGQTAIHRLATLAIRAVGMLPSLGVLHVPRSGHAALASDLQEPFRHLVDAVVIEATREFSPDDFRAEDDGAHALRIRPRASRRFFERLHARLALPVVGRDGGNARPYADWIADAARSLRAHLLNSELPFEVFRHP